MARVAVSLLRGGGSRTSTHRGVRQTGHGNTPPAHRVRIAWLSSHESVSGPRPSDAGAGRGARQGRNSEPRRPAPLPLWGLHSCCPLFPAPIPSPLDGGRGAGCCLGGRPAPASHTWHTAGGLQFQPCCVTVCCCWVPALEDTGWQGHSLGNPDSHRLCELGPHSTAKSAPVPRFKHYEFGLVPNITQASVAAVGKPALSSGCRFPADALMPSYSARPSSRRPGPCWSWWTGARPGSRKASSRSLSLKDWMPQVREGSLLVTARR